MATRAKTSPPTSVSAYLDRLRRRAIWLLSVRGLALGAGAALLVFALLSVLAGPVVSPFWASLAWGLVGACALTGVGFGLRPSRGLGGGGSARLLSAMRPELASAARSAVELEGQGSSSGASRGLIEAHRARVRSQLAQVPAQTVVPLRWLRHRLVGGGLAAALLAGAILFGVDGSSSGAFALLHPGAVDASGVTLADIVGRSEARLVFPAYLGRAPRVLSNPTEIEAPIGTSVVLTIYPRVEARDGVLEVVGRELNLTREPDGGLSARFVVRESGRIDVRVHDAEQGWLADPRRRWVRAVGDEAPRVALVEPSEDPVVELDATVLLGYEASDDVGLVEVALIVRPASGEESRQVVLRLEEGSPEREAKGTWPLAIAELGARPGDRITVRFEGVDGDIVHGPHVGRSEERVITVASEASRRAESIADLDGLLGLGLDALADRLELPEPAGAEEAGLRYERVQRSGRGFADAATRFGQEARGRATPGADASVYREMARRLQRLLRREGATHEPALHSLARRLQTDTALVEQLENDSLALADLLGRARLDDAAAIARELEALRREMTSLLAELRRTESPEARAALLTALGRAQARLTELAQRLARMSQDVPSDFLNASALPQQESEDALASLREALDSGDLDAAERALADFERQIDAMAAALGSAEEGFAEARFGPRDRAMAEAMDALAGLEAEERRLARRSDEVRRQAGDRALEASGVGTGDETDQLAQQARLTRDALRQLPLRSLGPLERETYERARQRLEDTEDALATGDLGEARRMSREAGRDLEELARDLELSALMFPGAHGETLESARAAATALQRQRGLAHEIDRAIPRVGDFVADTEREQLHLDANRQGEVGEAAERLAEAFRDGPDGNALSPDGAQAVDEARELMRDARRALERAEPVDAARAQEEAARKLTELREELEQNNQQNQSGGGGGEGGSPRPDNRQRVRIHGADEYQGPAELRRRVLDAMREDAPRGYEDALRRYYEELLR